ncbi:hypothetical protein EHP00_1285 [Ecytonucleospora hepatopenaei]|uniref:Uncharacterized protein n=1 Tax=Ecytonucleospora hepatopenaei TaxID=646526 RepID=A0A1W0E6W1_9MICR|nr:hypothetical protein EHP00_1285 [Ecytonucleospora hepatopenaei]
MKDVNDVYKNNLKNITKSNDDINFSTIFIKEESDKDITNINDNKIKQEVNNDIVKEELEC